MPEQKPNPHMTLASFFIEIAIDSKLRARFAKDPEGTLDAVLPPLEPLTKKIVLSRNEEAILEVLVFNNQSSGAKLGKFRMAPAKQAAKRKIKKAKR